jgi:drug/metabolite transporter (DMT)-like permease
MYQPPEWQLEFKIHHSISRHRVADSAVTGRRQNLKYRMAKQNLTSWALFFLLALVWGSSFILMKKSSEHLTGWQLGSTRIFAAGVLFLPFAVFHIRHIPLKKLHLVIISGFLGNLLPAFLFGTAAEKLDSSVSGILNSLTPLWVIVIGILFFKTKIQSRKIVGVLIGFIGLVLLNLSKGKVAINDISATLLILLATFMYGLNVNMVGHYLKGLNGIHVATVSMAVIGIIAGVVMWQHHVIDLARYDNEARPAILIAIVLGIVGSAVATALFYVLIQKSGTLFASLVTYAMPFVAIGWGLLAHEAITLVQVGCLGLILVGVYVANRN